MKYTLSLVFCLSALTISAQQTFTEKLQQVVESAGRIILHQDKAITDLVNNVKKSVAAPVQKRVTDGTVPQLPDSIAADSLALGPKVKINGFRIQVYFGDNSRKGKTEARAAGLRFRSLALPSW